MKRYDKTQIKDFEGKRGNKEKTNYRFNYLKPVILSPIPKSDSDIYVITQEGDRLDHLANQFYGDVNAWWVIAKANGLNFITVETGKTLRIPTLTNRIKGY